jgi:hypothetical protein
MSFNELFTSYLINAMLTWYSVYHGLTMNKLLYSSARPVFYVDGRHNNGHAS